MNDLSRDFLMSGAALLTESYENWRSLRPVTIYDQFGRPVYVPSGKKIGDTITIRKPYRYQA